MKWMLLALCFQVWANEIPKKEFHEPSEEDKSKVQQIVDAYEANSIKLGRHSSELLIESESDLELSNLAQLHCDDAKGNEKWLVSYQLTTDLRSEEKAVANMLTNSSYRVLFKKDHAVIHTGFEAIKSDDIGIVKEFLTSRHKAMYPLACPLLPVPVNEGFLKVYFNLLDPKRIKRLSFFDNYCICQYQFTGQVDLLRTIVFKDGLPVYMHENMGQEFIPQNVVRTTSTEWKNQDGRHVPVSIDWSSNGFVIDCEMKGSLTWRFDEELDDSEFTSF